jgi:hypothetical protein
MSYSKGEQSLSRFVREIHRPLLTWYSVTQYRLSNSEFEGKTQTLKGAIDFLQGEDFRILKTHPTALPKWIIDNTYSTILQPRSLFPIGESWRLPEWVLKKDIKQEWEQFIKSYILHVIGSARPESGGTSDQIATDVVWTVKIAAEDAEFFNLNRTIIEKLIRRLFPLAGDPHHTPPQVTYTDIVETMGALYPNHKWSHTEFMHIVQIIHKIRTTMYNLRFVEYRMDLLCFASIPYSPPQESRCDMIRSWYKATQTTHPSLTILPELFILAGAHTVRQGRNALFYRQPSPPEWASVKDYLAQLDKDIIQGWCQNAKDMLARVQYEDEQIIATADLIMDNTVVQIHTGSTMSDMKRLEVLIEIFLTVHLIRKLGHQITTAVLFQPLTGYWMEMDLSTWEGSALDTYVRSKLSIQRS